MGRAAVSRGMPWKGSDVRWVGGVELLRGELRVDRCYQAAGHLVLRGRRQGHRGLPSRQEVTGHVQSWLRVG
jgi:hypothetical protein